MKMRKRQTQSGAELEARIQRLFMCQGVFAERNLFVRTAGENSNLVTDVDVLAHDYSINFQHRRIYADCRGGTNVRPNERVVWISGMKEVVGAEFAYLVGKRCDSSTILFARRHNVDILDLASLAALEKSLRIGPGFWPGRSNLYTHGNTEELITKVLKNRRAEKFGQWLERATQVWREASALSFSYGRLNSLVSILQEVPEFMNSRMPNDDESIFRYAVSALLVRLSQYVLFAASDTLSMTKSAREKYIAEKLATGDTGPELSLRLLRGCTKMIDATLKEQGIDIPATWDPERMLKPPPYALSFANMIERIIPEGYQARILPLTMEVSLFGYGGSERDSGGLIRRVKYGVELARIIRAFAIQTLNIPEDIFRMSVDGSRNHRTVDRMLFEKGH